MVQGKKQLNSKPKFAEVVIGDNEVKEMRESTNARNRRNPYLKLSYPNGVTLILPADISIEQLRAYISMQITVSPYGGTYIIYYLCIRNQNSLIMETREYFEKVMQDYNQNRKGRSLRKYCKDEAVDYDWLIEFKKSYRSNQLQPDENKKLGEGEFIALTVEENFVPEQQTPSGWQVERLILKSPTGDEMEIKCTNLFAVAELLRKMS